MQREIKGFEAIREATDQCLAKDSRVYLMGLGVPDISGNYGTTLGLQKKYGPQRVMDAPTSESGLTGFAIGSALVGMRPVLTHLRVEFSLLGMEQIINNAAKWMYTYGYNVPLVIRMVIGRGWGQGPTHSQSLQSIFAHIPGLKVVLPTTPYDSKGLLIASIEDDNPVIFIEHRWTHYISGFVPEEMYRVPIGKAKTIRKGNDVTIVAISYMTLEALRAAEILEKDGIHADVIDLRTLRPWDREQILDSVKKTGRLIVVDPDWNTVGFSAEVVATVAEELGLSLKSKPRRIGHPEVPTPSSPSLANLFYPLAIDIVNVARSMFAKPLITEEQAGIKREFPLDVPDRTFKGPF